ncbi:MAG: class I SAM-dependent DNA methyltransferase [Caldilineaceae bacterium]|nr:class I SAM-dependent DNA methyltransferase [Caldilineaceae bacterium]MBP8106857.1 class I SAM-dependent DNA methyltransferase [Caldilineaceae bacterium]MBP8121751.1 class I SAM-dependent DNA methyltransferase [Caldilineaceae bacterium]MBP9071459.1 class I SAM-dependent DNA methyltransferase [Caldilineaceae bacterium]
MITPQQFVNKWRNVTLKERSAVQEHFIDLCGLVGHPTPAEDDPTGTRYTFEAGADKRAGGQGWADVWKKNFFAWEYKGKNADLGRAYQQLLQYRESLHNPPLLVVSDIDTIVVHPNFTNSVNPTVTLSLDDLLTPAGMVHLRAIFTNPEQFRSAQTPEQVTQEAATHFARLSALLREGGHDSQAIAHFLIRILFCLFAEDIGLLPAGLFTQLVALGRKNPDAFNAQLGTLFGAMSQGGYFGAETIPNFNGGLFDNATRLPLDRDGLDILRRVCTLDWSSIEPSILGTLFERSLDPAKRAQLGAHYTSKDDITLIVEPVLMAPLRREWAAVKEKAHGLAARRDEAKSQGQRTTLNGELAGLLQDFAQRLAGVRVLDPACGSANFLYVSLRLLLDLWKEVAVLTSQLGLSMLSPLPGFAPSPLQLYGIEINPYAHELAQATVWIGWIQWLHENGYGIPAEPILKQLNNIVNMDAILAYDEAGKPVEPEWPSADVVMGNPPFLGGHKMRSELGADYLDNLFDLYRNRVPGPADLVCYWFERARHQIEIGQVRRNGLLATNSIRGGANRQVLDRIKQTGNIFFAWGDRAWILDGAAVRVSMVGFDNGDEAEFELDGRPVREINADLSTAIDVTKAKKLKENFNIAYSGTKKGGGFDISAEKARAMLLAMGNPNGRPNSDVVVPWVNGQALLGKPRNSWIIDFGVGAGETEASLYEAPFEYVKANVYPQRQTNNRVHRRDNWWLHAEVASGMRNALSSLDRFIATPRIAKYRLFVWVSAGTLADDGVYVFGREDDYFFGVLHSKLHELWALRQGTSLEDRPRYTPTTTFETFPFPWPPGTEPVDDPQVHAIAQAAAELVTKRDAWLNPPGMGADQLKKRTLTNLYNQRPTWLSLAHDKLDKAVFTAYGWPHDLSDDEILERLLALNLGRSG